MNKQRIPLVRLKMIKEKELPYDMDISIRSKDDAVKLFQNIIDDSDRELFICLALGTNHKPTYIEVVSKGSLNSAIITPREVFKSAILSNSACVMFAHNHPSGDCIPSSWDINTTNLLENSAKILGIEILDHIILTDKQAFSFRENGLLSPRISDRSNFIKGNNDRSC